MRKSTLKLNVSTNGDKQDLLKIKVIRSSIFFFLKVSLPRDCSLLIQNKLLVKVYNEVIMNMFQVPKLFQRVKGNSDLSFVLSQN